LLAMNTAQAQVNVLSITEVGESPTPVVTFNGDPVTLDAASTLFKDNWTIVLPASFALSQGGNVFVGEPENATQVNSILVGTQPTTLTWESDVATPAGVSGLQNPLTLHSAGTFTTASGLKESFDLVLADVPGGTVPDRTSTTALLALMLLGLFGAARIQARRTGSGSN
jgi:hypothetical protein